MLIKNSGEVFALALRSVLSRGLRKYLPIESEWMATAQFPGQATRVSLKPAPFPLHSWASHTVMNERTCFSAKVPDPLLSPSSSSRLLQKPPDVLRVDGRVLSLSFPPPLLTSIANFPLKHSLVFISRKFTHANGRARHLATEFGANQPAGATYSQCGQTSHLLWLGHGIDWFLRITVPMVTRQRCCEKEPLSSRTLNRLHRHKQALRCRARMCPAIQRG